MTNLQLYFAVGVPMLVIVASLIISVLGVTGIRDEMRNLREDMRNLREDVSKQIAVMREDVSRQIAVMREDVNRQIAVMREDVRQIRNDLNELMGERHK
jgi:archaellum component FlaC